MTAASVNTQYGGLHAYLKSRYADLIVLTFAQIEDLMGFALPDRARANPEWWSNDGADESVPQSRVWRQASRTATPNLFACTVTFERVPG